MGCRERERGGGGGEREEEREREREYLWSDKNNNFDEKKTTKIS